MLTQLIKLAVQDIANPDDVVILTNISEGVDGATLFGIVEESPDPLVIEDGQTVQQRFRHTVNIRGLYDSADMAQLRTWAGSQTKVRLSGYTVDGFVLFNGDYLISPNAQFDSVDVTALMVTCEWLGTFVSGYRPIHIGENGLRNYDVTSGGANTLYGFSLDQLATGSVAGDDQTITVGATTAENTVYLRGSNIFFPFVGERLTASLNVGSLDAEFKVGIEFVEDDRTTVISTSLFEFDSVDRHSVTAIVPSGTFFIRFVIAAGGSVSTSDTVVIHSPCIRIGTGTTYTNW